MDLIELENYFKNANEANITKDFLNINIDEINNPE
jgi:hypothetical protein